MMNSEPESNRQFRAKERYLIVTSTEYKREYYIHATSEEEAKEKAMILESNPKDWMDEMGYVIGDVEVVHCSRDNMFTDMMTRNTSP